MMSITTFGGIYYNRKEDESIILQKINGLKNGWSFCIHSPIILYPSIIDILTHHANGMFFTTFEITDPDGNAEEILSPETYCRTRDGDWVPKQPCLLDRLKELEKFFMEMENICEIVRMDFYLSGEGYCIESDYQPVVVAPDQFARKLYEEYEKIGPGVPCVKMCIQTMP